MCHGGRRSTQPGCRGGQSCAPVALRHCARRWWCGCRSRGWRRCSLCGGGERRAGGYCSAAQQPRAGGVGVPTTAGQVCEVCGGIGVCAALKSRGAALGWGMATRVGCVALRARTSRVWPRSPQPRLAGVPLARGVAVWCAGVARIVPAVAARPSSSWWASRSCVPHPVVHSPQPGRNTPRHAGMVVALTYVVGRCYGPAADVERRGEDRRQPRSGWCSHEG